MTDRTMLGVGRFVGEEYNWTSVRSRTRVHCIPIEVADIQQQQDHSPHLASRTHLFHWGACLSGFKPSLLDFYIG